MLSKEQKEQIMSFADKHNSLLFGKTASKNEWEDYFKTYSDGADYIMDQKGFVFYEEKPDHIFIKDFISFGEGLGLMNQLISKKKPLYGAVYLTNIDVINTALRRFKFEITGIQNGQYIIKREVKNG